VPGPEPELGLLRDDPALGPEPVVLDEEAVEVPEDRRGGLTPQERPPRQPALLDAGELLGGDGLQCVVVVRRPRLPRADASFPGQGQLPGREALEDGVDQRPPVGRADDRHVLGSIDHPDAQDPLHQVAAGALGIGLEARGRHGAAAQ